MIEDLTLKAKIQYSTEGIGALRQGQRAVDEHTKALRRQQQAMEELRTVARQAAIGMTALITVPVTLFANKAVNAASDLVEAQNKVDVVFGQSASTVRQFAETAAESLGQSEQQALEAAGTFGNLFTAMGMGQDESARMSVALVKLASDLASFNNIDPTEVLQKLRSGLVGEVEPMRVLGVQLSEQAVKLKAVEMGLVATGEELTAAQKIQARYALILEQTKSAQGDFARTARDAANATRILRAQYEDMAASVGAKLLPIKLRLVQTTGSLIEQFNALPGAVQTGALALVGIGAAIGPTFLVIDQAVQAYRRLKSALDAATISSGRLAKAMKIGGPLSIGLAAIAIGMWYLNARTADTVRTLDELTQKLDIVAEKGGAIGISGPAMDVAQLSRKIEEIETERTRLRGALQDIWRERNVLSIQGLLRWGRPGPLEMRAGGPGGIAQLREYYEQLGIQREQLIAARERALQGEDIDITVYIGNDQIDAYIADISRRESYNIQRQAAVMP